MVDVSFSFSTRERKCKKVKNDTILLYFQQIPDGFFAHFYAICEHISPVLAWGFLGPRNSLYDLCCFFKVCSVIESFLFSKSKQIRLYSVSFLLL